MTILLQQVFVPVNGIGDLLMALVAIGFGTWVYRNGPQEDRTMLRFWVLAFVFLCFGGMMGATLESMGNSMSNSEVSLARLILAGAYMAAGLFQLYAVLEIIQASSLGKDLLKAVAGAAYLILLVIAVIYEFPDAKMYFLIFSTSAALIVLLISGRFLDIVFRRFLIASVLQAAGVMVYFLQIRLLGMSESIFFNLLMLGGMVAYLAGLHTMARRETTSPLNPQLHKTPEVLSSFKGPL